MGMVDNSQAALTTALTAIKSNLTAAAQVANTVKTASLTPRQMVAIHDAVAASLLLYEAVHRLIE